MVGKTYGQIGYEKTYECWLRRRSPELGDILERLHKWEEQPQGLRDDWEEVAKAIREAP